MSRILVVEDDPDHAEALAYLLETEGHQVALAQNGLQALEALEHGAARPDLILVDLVMPLMDGRQFIREVRRRGLTDIPIEVFSASELPAGEDRQLGAQGYLAKPFELQDLLAEVRRLTLPSCGG